MKTSQTLQELIALRTQLKLTLKEVENSIAKFSCVVELDDHAALTVFFKQNKEFFSVGDKVLLKTALGGSPNVVFEYRGTPHHGACAFFVSITPEYEGSMNIWLDRIHVQ
jgi:hypothetical protein